MPRLLTPAGTPLAEAQRQLRRGRQFDMLPTGAANAAASTGLTATAVGSATPNTKGSWVEVTAATTTETHGLTVVLTTNTAVAGTASSALLDVGVGGAGSEVVVVPDLAVGWSSIGRTYQVPLFIPIGSRIAVRVAGVEASKSVGVLLIPRVRSAGFRPSAAVTALGVDAANSKGVTLATPAGSNVEGAWTEIIAATAETYRGLAAGIQGGADIVQTLASGLIDIAIGSAGNEVPIIQNIQATTTTAEAITVFDSGAFAVDVPAGSRLSGRVQLSSIASTLDVILYGVR